MERPVRAVLKQIVTFPPTGAVDDAFIEGDVARMEMNGRRLPGASMTGLKSLAWIVGGIATAAAVAVAAVFALLMASAVVVLAVVGSVLAMLTGMALRARRTVRTSARRGGQLLEARKVGQSWVAYGWDERVR